MSTDEKPKEETMGQVKSSLNTDEMGSGRELSLCKLLDWSKKATM